MDLMEAEQKIMEILQELEDTHGLDIEGISIAHTETTTFADPTRVYVRKVKITTRARYVWEHGPA